MEDQKRMVNAAELSDNQLAQAGGGLGTHINYLPQNDLVTGSPELSDDELDQVVGGYGIGDTVRGVLDGQMVYWVTLNCCGKKSTAYEWDILG